MTALVVDSLSLDFLVTATIVVLLPGTGVLYTLSTALFEGRGAGILAAFGCTLGTLPHLGVSLLGLAALVQASPLAFRVVAVLGAAYLLVMAWEMWRAGDGLAPAPQADPTQAGPTQAHVPTGRTGWSIVVKGVAVNLLNPKLSVFFLAFLPQFVPADAADGLARMAVLGGLFAGLTFVVFVGYGLGAAAVRNRVLATPRRRRWLHRAFALAFTAFALRLALAQAGG